MLKNFGKKKALSGHSHHSSKLFTHPKNFFKLLFFTQLTSDIRHYPSKIYETGMDNHYNMLRHFWCYAVPIAIFLITEIYVTIIHDRAVACTNIYLHIGWYMLLSIIKGPLSSLRKFLTIENPLKMMKNVFFFSF